MKNKFGYFNSNEFMTTDHIDDLLKKVIDSNNGGAALYVRADLVKEFKEGVTETEAAIMTADLECLDERWGLCPKCRGIGDGCNIGPVHIAFCEADKTKWFIGANLFSGWRDETEETWEANKEKLKDYEEVESFHYISLVRDSLPF